VENNSLSKYPFPEAKAVSELLEAGLQIENVFRASCNYYRKNIENKLIQKGPLIVQSGLFKGMLLFPGSFSSALLPKWQGTYEKEVQIMLEKHALNIDYFINVGCGEGFYLGGVSRWLKIPSVGIDIDPDSRIAVDYISKVNGLQNLISFSHSMDLDNLNIVGNLLVLIDVDGAEESTLILLERLLAKLKDVTSILLFIETDLNSEGKDNTTSIVEKLTILGYSVQSNIQQNPSCHFLDSYSNYLTEATPLSFMEQALYSAECRRGGQSWIMATHSN